MLYVFGALFLYLLKVCLTEMLGFNKIIVGKIYFSLRWTIKTLLFEVYEITYKWLKTD